MYDFRYMQNIFDYLPHFLSQYRSSFLPVITALGKVFLGFSISSITAEILLNKYFFYYCNVFDYAKSKRKAC